MSGTALLLFPYAIDWDGREDAKQAMLRAFLAHGADFSRQFEGPSLPSRAANAHLSFDIAVSRFVDQIRRLATMAEDPAPSMHYQRPRAFVTLEYSRPFDQRVVQLIQRLVSAAPGLGAAALILLCDFTADPSAAAVLRSAGSLDREDPLKLPILRLESTGSRLLVLSHDISYPFPELSGRICDLMTPPEPAANPRFPSSSPGPPPPRPVRSKSGPVPRITLDDALLLPSGRDKK